MKDATTDAQQAMPMHGRGCDPACMRGIQGTVDKGYEGLRPSPT